MNKKFLAAAAIPALLLCGCSKYEPEPPTVRETTTAVTISPYLLVRNWEGRELLNSIYCCGEYRPLPMDLEDFPDITYSDGTLFFPDGSFAEAEEDTNGNICAVRFKKGSAPADTDIYGINFRSDPNDILVKVGAANSIIGEMDDDICYYFYGGGITELTFVFKNRALTEVYIAA